jgi:transposase
MAGELIPHDLWNLIAPLLPRLRPKPKSERPRITDRACLQGIVFVLGSGIPWDMLPQELGYGSGMTCWRRLRDWQEAGIWGLIRFALLDWLSLLLPNRLVRRRSGQLVGASCFWGPKTGPNPTDRAKLSSKRHLICDAHGIPLVIQLTGATEMIRRKHSLSLKLCQPCKQSAGVAPPC